MTLEQLPTPSTIATTTLEDAWQRFAKYDHNANIAQRRFMQQRVFILGLAVAATTLAITNAALKEKGLMDFPWLPNATNLWLQQAALPVVLRILEVVVIVVPIVLTAITAYSIKFNMGINWVMLRSSAESLKKEIYCYRTQVNEYNPDNLAGETREVRLARRIKLNSKRLMETAVNQFGLESYSGKLPPRNATPQGDDGFSDLTPNQYIEWRVQDQFNYYQKRGLRLGRELQRYQLSILLLGGLGTLLVAFRLDVWLAVSSALAAALASFLEIKRTENNLISCNLAASDLYDIRTWWRALPAPARTQRRNIELLVTSAEAVIQGENSGWVQEMREALSEIYDEERKKESHARLEPEPTEDVHIRMQPDPLVEGALPSGERSSITEDDRPSPLSDRPDRTAPPNRDDLPTQTQLLPVKASEPEV